MEPRQFSLDDRYSLESGRVFMSGIQALVRLSIMQRKRDQNAGLDTAGFISGYRGSPLGGFDRELWRVQDLLQANRIIFRPGINEDLAATAVAGSQQIGLFPGARHAGVFGIWYGKAPGLDRSCDAVRHGNAAGTSKHGGVLLVVGDDHGCKSSTLASQSEYVLQDIGIPVLHPSGVQEVLDYGMIGWAMSRYTGCWVGLIALADTMDSSATVDVDPQRPEILIPQDFAVPQGGLHIRRVDSALEKEERLLRYKLFAAHSFARANHLDRLIWPSPSARFGILTAGKTYLDVRQALEELGIDEAVAERCGIRLCKVGMTWPLEPEAMHEFSDGLQEILVVEEKRALMENQLKMLLWEQDDTLGRIVVTGKRDEQHRDQFTPWGELDSAAIAEVLTRRLPAAALQAGQFRQGRRPLEERPARIPYFCAGCPHNTSTQVPEGSRALAGIGCHYMAQWMDRRTDTFTQMGGEGLTWMGQAPFTDEPHVFVNLGDGTYFHSGTLAIRAAVASGVNVTYKLLYNDAVAMTGGQPADGALDVPQTVQQLIAEGVRRVAVVSDHPEAFKPADVSPATLHDRHELEAVQLALRGTPGCTVLIYAQPCATELRRKRKRGRAPDPDEWVVIHDGVCEGCGDCSLQSNCVALEPVATEHGLRRRVSLSACNKDYSCVEGFCPSFVSVRGERARLVAKSAPKEDLPEPEIAPLDVSCNILVAGVGGTGIVTVGALLGTAAHIDGLAASTLDMTGLAQKGGAVVSQIRIATDAEHMHSTRIPAGKADLLLAADLIASDAGHVAACLDADRTRILLNEDLLPTGDFVLHGVTADSMKSARIHSLQQRCLSLDRLSVSSMAAALLGDAMYANALMLGFAAQKGWLPVSLEALRQSIRLNGVAVENNHMALMWGRHLALDPDAVRRVCAARSRDVLVFPQRSESLQEFIAAKAQYLVAYQNQDLADRYRLLVDRVAQADKALKGKAGALTRAVAHGYFRVLACKDEYEVARLLTAPEFQERLDAEFSKRRSLSFHMAPPLLARMDKATGRPRKMRFGPWLLPVMRVLARAKFIRGTKLDPFSYSAERRAERAWVRIYAGLIPEILTKLRADNYETAVELASLPVEIRGFGPIKMASMERADKRLSELRLQLDAQPDAAMLSVG